MKLRGVERAAAVAVDTIPPPHLSYQQHPPSAGECVLLLRGRQGQVKVDLQIGHSPQETIINKAVSARSPLKGH